jgi:hypothetical protein
MNHRSLRAAAAVWLLALVPPVTAFAHDTWLVPAKVRSDELAPVQLRLMTGDVFPVSDAATKPERVESSVAYQGSRPVRLGEFRTEGSALVADLTPDVPGAYVAAISLRPHPIVMEASEFEAYLREEHATKALELRAAMGEGGKPGHELYTKCTKTFVRFTSTGGSNFGQVVGHPLEIVPLSDPATWGTGGQAEVMVLLSGQKAKGIRVSVGREGTRGHAYEASVETDDKGEARLPLGRAGLSYLRAHTIRRIPAKRASDHGPRLPSSSTGPDWESFWATLTFGVDGEPGSNAAIEAVRAVHGGAGPWAVLGYRMGSRALHDLGLVRGSFDLDVVHETPMEVQYTCVADGVQAATGATVGRMNLKLVETSVANLKTVFRHRVTGATITIRPSESFRQKFLNVPMHELSDRGKEVAAMKDDDLMTVEVKP